MNVSVIQALLKMDCQGLVARLVMDFVLLTTAVEVAGRWRELAERLAKVSRQQMEAYEAPHKDAGGQLDSEVKSQNDFITKYYWTKVDLFVNEYFVFKMITVTSCSSLWLKDKITVLQEFKGGTEVLVTIAMIINFLSYSRPILFFYQFRVLAFTQIRKID